MDKGNHGNESITNELLRGISGAEFNERIIGWPLLNCKRCARRLTPPIMLIKDFGNVCGNCEAVPDGNVIVHDFSFEKFLDNFVVPCINISEGCNLRLNYASIVKHELICSYRRFKCPLHLLTVGCCAWEGILSSLQKHFAQEHANLIYYQTIGQFNINVDVSKDTEIIRLVCNRDNYSDNFIVRIKCDLDELKLKCIVYYTKTRQKETNLRYSIQLQNNSVVMNSKVDNVVHEEVDLPTVFDSNKSIQIDLSFMKEKLAEEKKSVFVKASIRIDVEDKQVQEKLDEDVLRLFECTVCSYSMKPPIHLCANGHSLCSLCRPKLQHCPTCREGFSTARNQALEEFAKDVYFPCIYYDAGCRFVSLGSEIAKHELECSFKLYFCPVSTVCSWEGIRSSVINHVKMHDHSLIYSNYHSIISNFTDKFQLHYMVVDDQLFAAIGRMVNGSFFCGVILITGTKQDAKNYQFEMGVIDSENSDKRLIHTRSCGGFRGNPVPTIEDYSVFIPFSTLTLYKKTDCYMYYFKISKGHNQKTIIAPSA